MEWQTKPRWERNSRQVTPRWERKGRQVTPHWERKGRQVCKQFFLKDEGHPNGYVGNEKSRQLYQPTTHLSQQESTYLQTQKYKTSDGSPMAAIVLTHLNATNQLSTDAATDGNNIFPAHAQPNCGNFPGCLVHQRKPTGSHTDDHIFKKITLWTWKSSEQWTDVDIFKRVWPTSRA